MTLEDLILMHNIIAAMTERGAIRPDEMHSVGNLYEKLGKFIEEIKASYEEPQEPQEDEDIEYTTESEGDEPIS